ncbi:MAG: ShlB/FhaC/HecB family hemolysin secretion/activation protein [Saprospiraceae bacterium]|nr:ShlB/FhaC/HecB family hemolysin secretion/activation protein [Saprospiraceae bacterium]
MIICLIGVLFVQTGNAQISNLELRLLPLDTTPAFLQKNVKFKTSHPDSVSVVIELQNIIHQLQNQFYLEASVDTLQKVDNTFVALLHVGKAYEWINLQNGNIDALFLDESGFRERFYQNRPFSPTQLQKLQENLLVAAENNGYPFAKVWLDSLQFTDNQVTATLMMDKGQLVLIDNIETEGELRISKNYISNYLGIKLKSAYNRAQILRIRQRLRELPFVNMSKDPQITFAGDRATLKLFLDKRRASRFDFLIGVLPNSTQVNRLLITGSFNGELYNQFGRGERIYAEFEALRPQTQELNLQFNYPYLFNLPFGIDAKFNLYKRDSTYLDIESDFGVQYLFQGGNYLKAFWNNRTSNLLNIDSALLNNAQRLPPTLDVSYGNFGLEYVFQNLDYRYNPRKGWHFLLRGAAGVKQIKRNNRVEALETESVYDSLELRSFQYRLNASVERYLAVFNRSTIKLGVQGAYIISQEPIYLNEQYRIGGNKLLRGFDEEFIFATNYTIATFEYRLLIGQNSYLYTFGDYAYVENLTIQTRDRYYPYGFGAGITFETRAGLFGVNLAFGTRQGEAIDFAAPKVHFGYVSLF